MTSLLAPRGRDIERYARLPARVRRAIAEQQDQSEQLIGWFQLAVVTLFGTLYAVSPKSFAPDSPFEPVPWVLSIYFLFTVLRVVLARRGAMAAPILYLSVVIDIALLLILIWSFHLQYKQPPSFYLKAPTLLYVFIFIALRALRFEARFVVLTGVVAAVGWLALVLYAIVESGDDGMMVTRDYVYYMTSNSILIGAEIDKIVSILTVTAIIAVAITRARRLLIRAAAEGAAAQELSRFFAPEIAEQITASEETATAGAGEAREAAVLMCDIRGFSRFAARTLPGEVMALLADYQHRMVPIIQRYGGTIDKFMGDGIMATFGAAAPTATFAADALRAVDDLMAEAARWNEERSAATLPPVEVGAAVASGRVVFGAVGHETRLEFTVIGDTVNRAAKLEKHTKAEAVRALADAETWRTALAQGYVPPAERKTRPARMIQGMAEPLDVVVLAA